MVSVTGSQDYAQTSVYAIEQSFIELQPKIANLRCLLISPEPPAYCPAHIQHISLGKFSYLEYNYIMLFILGELVQTDFVLIVQNDGWVLNGHFWRDEFFHYDYIGAPVKPLVEFDGDQFIRRLPASDWEKYKNCQTNNLVTLMNGGFCLRSRRLLNALREFDIKWQMLPPIVHYNGMQLSFGWQAERSIHLEDFFLAGYQRKNLESKGFRFAPPEVAAYFSSDGEHLECNLHYQVGLEQVLGWHNYFNITGIKQAKLMQKYWHLDRHSLQQSSAVQVLLSLGYQVYLPE